MRTLVPMILASAWMLAPAARASLSNVLRKS
jgi:hypothetical protein